MFSLRLATFALVSSIVDATAKDYEIRAGELLKGNKPKAVQARRMAMYLSRSLGCTHNALCVAFERHGSSVTSGIGWVSGEMRLHPDGQTATRAQKLLSQLRLMVSSLPTTSMRRESS